MRVALVHDWLTGMRGGERCLEALCELFPAADIYTLLHLPGRVSPAIERHRITTSFVQRLPDLERRYRHYLPLFPLAIARFDLSGYDLVLSASHCVAKGARAGPGGRHVCYCFTPMRYVWDLYDDYFGARAGVPLRLAMPALAATLRRWDRRTSTRVHDFVAISRVVADRIRRCYGREAPVIHPPVDCVRFTPTDPPDDFYLVVSALVPYKRVDLAIGAAGRLRRRLVVVGTGPEAGRLRRLAGPDVQFLGWRDDAEVARLYARCRALLFPGREDFGIAPLEAMAAGRPVVAYGADGVLETVVPLDGAAGPATGVFFGAQTVEAMADAMTRLETARGAFDPVALRARAEAFDRPRFLARVAAFVQGRVGAAGAC